MAVIPVDHMDLFSENIPFLVALIRAIKASPQGDLVATYPVNHVSEDWGLPVEILEEIWEEIATHRTYRNALTESNMVLGAWGTVKKANIDPETLDLNNPPSRWSNKFTPASKLLSENLTKKDDGLGKTDETLVRNLTKQSSVTEDLGKIKKFGKKSIRFELGDGGILTLKWQKCGKPTCRCNNGQLHGPYAWKLIRDTSRPSGYRWHSLGKVGGERCIVVCQELGVDHSELATLAKEFTKD